MSIVSQLLNQFAPIGLSEMKDVALMNRVDTKFIFHNKHLPKLLNALKADYRILQIDAERISTYKNLYFDTEQLKFYHDHHNGKTNRLKVRIRKYVETDVCYLEVKRKNNKGRTFKKRIAVEDLSPQLSTEEEDFVNAYGIAAENLKPVLGNEFKRITLVSLENEERITLDLKLSYNHQGNAFTYDDLVVAEVKQAEFKRNTPFFNVLKSKRINPYRISKYCIGMATTRKTLRQNAFKEKLRRIVKIAG